MTQAQLVREVAQATGEFVGTIHQMGFGLVAVPTGRRHRRRAKRRRSRRRSRPGLADTASGQPTRPAA